MDNENVEIMLNETVSESIIKVFVFQIGTQSFGIEIDRMKGVVCRKDIISNENTVKVGNTLIPVMDLHEKFQMLSSRPDTEMILLIESGNNMLAVPIDGIERIYDVPSHNLYSVPSTARNRENNAIKKIAALGEQLIPVVAPEQLFTHSGDGLD